MSRAMVASEGAKPCDFGEVGFLKMRMPAWGVVRIDSKKPRRKRRREEQRK